MSALRNKITQRLTVVPDDMLQEVLTYLNYLVWQNQNPRSPEDMDWLESDISGLGSYEPYQWQEGELEEGLPVRFIDETGKIEISV